MEVTRLCLAGVTISMLLLGSVVLNSGYSLAFEISQASTTSRRRDNGFQTVLDLLDFVEQEEEERHLEEEFVDESNHQREKRFPRIPMGLDCSQRPCRRSHCCARKFGQPVCRMRPTLGQPCRPNPQSHHANEMFTTCPCAHGLKCWKKKGRKGVCV